MIFDNTQLKIELKFFLQQRFFDFFQLNSEEQLLTATQLPPQLADKPCLNIVQVGKSLASQKYASLKVKMGQQLGVETFYYRFEEVDGQLLLWKNGDPCLNWQDWLGAKVGVVNSLSPSWQSVQPSQKNFTSRSIRKNSNSELEKLTNQQKIELFIQQLAKLLPTLNSETDSRVPRQNSDSDWKKSAVSSLNLKLKTYPKNGLILQLPLPPEMASLPEKINWSDFADVDFLGPDQSKLWHAGLLPPTIQAIDLVLKTLLKNQSPKTEITLTSKIPPAPDSSIIYSQKHTEQNNLSTAKNQPSLQPLQTQKLNNVESESQVITSLLGQQLDLSGQVVAIIGQGKLVGAPLLSYFQKTQATILSLNKDTPDKPALTRLASLVVCASGVPNLVQSSWLSPEVIVIDAATSESNGILAGDVDQLELENSQLPVRLCPSPGGIGPLTVLSIFWNLYQLWTQKISD